MQITVQSFTVTGVPFRQTPHPEIHFIFGEDVAFKLSSKGKFIPVLGDERSVHFISSEEGWFNPVFVEMKLDASWFRSLMGGSPQGILSPVSGMVFVNRIGDLEEWRISSFGPRFSVEIDKHDNLVIEGTFEEMSKIFRKIGFND
jgi:hypothetical protein